MKTIGIVIAWAMCALLVLILLLVPLARHADRRGRPGLLHHAVAKLRRLSLSALLALAVAFGGSVAHSGKTNGVQNIPPRPMLQLPAPTPHSIFDYPRTITDSRAASGFALVGVGTNETFTFDPPTNAAVCADWRTYGSFSRWTHVSPTNFAFPFGGTNATTFTFVPGGVAEFAGGADAPCVAPFDAKMGIAPERYWDSLGVTSRFWTATSPSNTFLATWQGALLGRRADRPVDVQLELFPDGGFDFRYDLSRCGALGERALPGGDGGRGETALPDVRVGAWNAGGGEWYSIPSNNVTSARWRPVAPDDALNPDRDNDGVTTVDELFFLGTDPGNPDSDFDGLSDGDEITHGLNPLDPYSNGGPYTDGFAAKIGDLNPLACPQDSTYTFYEHVIYSGSTNGMVTVPASTAAFALLEVDVSGTGTGDLVVGTRSLPLVGGASPVCLAVPRALRLDVRLRRRTGSLQVSLDSEDFAIGETPGGMSGDPSGWISFPRTRPIPEVACIHDLCERKITVRIDPGYGADGISATWWGTAAVAASNHADNLSATLTGNFDAHHTARVWYALDHPLRLLGMGAYWQSVRFCPRPSDASDEPVDDPWDDPWYVPDPTDPGTYDDLYDGESPGTHLPPCDCCSICRLNGGAGCEHHTPAPSEVSGPAPTDPQSPCPVHNCPYSECADLHGDDAPRTAWVPTSTHVLKIGRMPTVDAVALTVPEGAVNCCPCPDHWTNWVGVAHLPGHVAVKGGDGLDFWKSATDCTAYVTGTSPTRLSERASLAFATNGTIHIRRDYMVLGVDIDTPNHTAARLNALSPAFGIPMTVCTNVDRAAGIDLVTRVRLAAGAVTLTAGGGAFKAWLDRSSTGQAPLLLVDGTTRPTVTMSLAKWRSLASLTGDENEARTRILLTSAAPGSRTLTFSFSAGGELNDAVVQRITFVKPPFLADYNWDFSADIRDALDQGNGRTNYFWTNHDTWRGDDAFAPYSEGIHPWPMTLPDNSGDMVVNGRNDLVNLCPFAVDLSAFVSAWGTAGVRYVFYTGSPGNVRFVPVRTKWNKLDGIVKEEQKTIFDEDLHSSALLVTSIEGGRESGYVLPPELLSLRASETGALAVEFVAEGLHALRISVEDAGSGDVLFDSPVSVRALDVHDMYRWLNLEAACGADAGPTYAERLSVLWPDSEHADANVVFVHGYNMHPSEVWDWSQAMFKRLRWSGMDAGFTAVLWRGNESQWWIPKVLGISESNGYATKNYHQNVLNAFRTAGAFATNVNDRIPGARKYMIAHSLGNMLVSAARQFHGLHYDQYFMLNAAVPVEAYDPDGGVNDDSKAAMTPADWRPYPDRVRSTHWHELFLDTPGDARQGLTWKGLFKDVDNTINFYSSADEVVANGDGGWKWPLTREYAWYNQEHARGSYLVSFSPQAGWEFSDHYVKEVFVGFQNGVAQYRYRKYEPDETFAIADTNLMVRPFFKDFSDERIYGEGGSAFLQANDMVRWYALSHGIPAESFAAGANPVLRWGASAQGNVLMSSAYKEGLIRNVNMARNCISDTNVEGANEDEKELPWIHSYFIGNSLFDTTILYEALAERIGTTKPKEVK